MIIPISPSRRASDAPNNVRLRKAERQARKLLRRIEREIAKGSTGKARFLQRRYLSSFDAKLATLCRVNRRLPDAQRIHKTRLLQNAEALNPWRGTNEQAVVRARPKSGGGFRPILSYGPQARALQLLARSAIRPFVSLDARQFAVANGGREAAVARINDGIRQGMKWFVRLDIVNFYQNIDERRLVNLVPAPRGVVLNTAGPPRNVILGHSSRVVSPSTLLLASRRGLSQGASSSPIIAEIIVSQILAHIPSDAFVINIADDFAIMARTKREAVALSKALASVVRRCPFGHLQLDPKSDVRRVSDGFSFLGYDFRFRRLMLQCGPSRANVTKFLVRVGCILQQLGTHRGESVQELQRYVRSWRNAFGHWDAGPAMFAPRAWVVRVSESLGLERGMTAQALNWSAARDA